MDQEGTVVYFETSPSATQLKLDASSHDVIEDDLIYSDTATGGQQRSDSSEIADTRNQSSIVSSYFAEMKYMLKEWLYVSSHLEAEFSDKVVTHIKNSPLLTEEDFQLLHISFASDNNHSSQQSQTNVPHTTNNTTMLYVLLCSIGTALISAGWMWSPLLLLAMTIIALFVLLLTRLLRLRTVSKMSENFNNLTSYMSHFDTLLSLLSQSIRVIQETEILAHGFSRPSHTVPIGRMERSKLQCVSLRRRVFGLCQSGVVMVRGVTERLCLWYPLSEELDERQGYLAFRTLDSLHEFMSDRNEEEGKEMEMQMQLKLESLKDACNLLAVQNSELLRRLALVIGHNNSLTKRPHYHFTAVLQHLKQSLEHLKSSSRDLQWSLEFHKNSLFGEPPSRTLGEKKNAKDDIPLQTVADQVHCMDLKAQFTLERIRELGEQLVVQDSAVDIESVRQHLVLIQHNLEGITEHITDSLELLDKLESSSSDGRSQKSLEDDSLPADSLETQVGDISLEQLPANEECPSDDEVVYEAYVPITSGGDESAESLCDQFSEAEREEFERQQKEAREVPLRMLKELNSVLAVRNTQKEKKRSERKKKRKQQTLQPLPTNTGTTHTTGADHVIISTGHSDTDGGRTTDNCEQKTSEKASASLCLQTTSVASPPSSSRTGEPLQPSLPNTDTPPTEQQAIDHLKTDSSGGLGHSAIAQAVAAAVLKSKRVIQSEEFLHEAEEESEVEEN